MIISMSQEGNNIISNHKIAALFDNFITPELQNSLFLFSEQSHAEICLGLVIFEKMIISHPSNKKITIICENEEKCEQKLHFLLENLPFIQKFKKEYAKINLDNCPMGIISSALEDNTINFNKIDLMTPKMFADYSKEGFYGFAKESELIVFDACDEILSSEDFFNSIKKFSNQRFERNFEQAEGNPPLILGFANYSELLKQEDGTIEKIRSYLKKFDLKMMVYDKNLENFDFSLEKCYKIEIFHERKFEKFFGDFYQDLELIFSIKNFEVFYGISAHMVKFYNDFKEKILSKAHFLSETGQNQINEIDKYLKKYAIRILHEVGNEGLCLFILRITNYLNTTCTKKLQEKNEIDTQCFTLLRKMLLVYLRYFEKQLNAQKNGVQYSEKFEKIISILTKNSFEGEQILIFEENKMITSIIKEILENKFQLDCNWNWNYNESDEQIQIKYFLKKNIFYKTGIFNEKMKKITFIDNFWNLPESKTIMIIYNRKKFQNYDIFLQSSKQLAVIFIASEHQAENLKIDLQNYQESKQTLIDSFKNMEPFTSKLETLDSVEKLIIDRKQDIVSNNSQPFLLQKINKIDNLRLKINDSNFYFLYSNEFLYSRQPPSEYHLYSIDFYFEQIQTFMPKNSLQLGLIFFGEFNKKELERFPNFFDSSLKITMNLKFIKTIKNMSGSLLKSLKTVDSFLWSAINDDDLYFYQCVTGTKLETSGFFRSYVKTSAENKKFLPKAFDYQKDYMTLCLLKKEEQITIAFEKNQEIELYIEQLKEYYLYFNGLYSSKLKNEAVAKIKIKPLDFELYDTSEKKHNLIVQNITNFRKQQIKNVNTIRTEDFANFPIRKKNKKSKTLSDHKNELENSFDCTLNDEEKLLKVLALTKSIEDYIKVEFFNGKPKNTFSDDDLKRNLCFESEFVVFPLEFDLMVHLSLLDGGFMQNIRDFIKIVKFKQSLFKLLKRESLNEIEEEEMFIEELNFSLKLCQGYVLDREDNFVLKNAILIENMLKETNHFLMEDGEFNKLMSKQDRISMFIEYEPLCFDLKNFEIDVSLLKIGMTFSKCIGLDNYERLEFLGDAILKLLATIQVFCQNPRKMEGELTSLRKDLICNDFLSTKSVIFHFFKFVLNEKNRFIPPCYLLEFPEIFKNRKEHCFGINKPENFYALPNKSLADLVESLTSVIYLSNNKDLRYSQWFLNKIDVLNQKFLEINFEDNAFHLHQNINNDSLYLMQKFSFFQRKIGYAFKNKGFLLQAFTHISFKDVITECADNKPQQNMMVFLEKLKQINPSEFCNERLEFLGDAVIDFFICDMLFSSNLKENPGGMSLKKTMIVNNKSLALVALNYDFDELLLIKNSAFSKGLDKVKSNLNEYFQNPQVFRKIEHQSFKMLADTFEAFVGALLIDSELNFMVVQKILKEMMEPLIVRLL